MHISTATMFLQAWEQGLTQSPTRRALTLLATVYPDASLEALALAPIGERDGYLLTLREWAFGPRLDAQATCPACAQALDLAFNLADIRTPPVARAAEELSLEVAGYQVHYRLPNTLDLLILSDHTELNSARQELLDRCLLAVRRVDGAPADGPLPEGVVEAVVAGMADADPQGDVQLVLTCPACAHEWPAIFDIVSFCWDELNAWAYRILREIHTLAAAYGWSEAEILALSPRRRQFYLEQVSG